MVNYLARLGWSHGDREIFSREELVERFDIKDVSSSAAVFDRTKLEWLSQHYLKTMEPRRLADLAAEFVRRAGLPVPEADRLARIVVTLRERAKTLVELVDAGRFYFERPRAYEPEAFAKFLGGQGGARLDALAARLERLGDFSVETLEGAYRELTGSLGLKLVDLAQATRVAVTGRAASPPIFDVLAILDRDETLARLRAARARAGGGA